MYVVNSNFPHNYFTDLGK